MVSINMFEKYCLKCRHYWSEDGCSYYDETIEDIEKDIDGDFIICFTDPEE